jgi:copper chaperone NosL
MSTATTISAVRSGGGVRAAGLPVLAAALLLLSLLFPYWRMTLFAPQYPGGLTAYVYLTHAAGDADEISNLNHYIGMTRLEDAAPLERMFAVPMVGIAAAALAVSALLPRWRLALRIPAIAFPVGMVADLGYWLWRFGHTLDPAAPIDVDPFMPALVGRGEVMQFSTSAMFGLGFFLALAAAALAIYDLRRPRRP